MELKTFGKRTLQLLFLVVGLVACIGAFNAPEYGVFGKTFAALFLLSMIASLERTCFDKKGRGRWVLGIFMGFFGIALGFWVSASWHAQKEKKRKAKEEERRERLRLEEEEERERLRLEERARYWASPEGQREKALIEEKKEEERKKRLLRERRKALLNELVDISGVSDKVARTLLDQFPTKGSIRKASVKDLSSVPGVGKSIATAIKARIK